MAKRFVVYRLEQYMQPVLIEDDNISTAEEALQAVADGEGEDIEDKIEYHSTCDREDWGDTIELKPGEEVPLYSNS